MFVNQFGVSDKGIGFILIETKKLGCLKRRKFWFDKIILMKMK